MIDVIIKAMANDIVAGILVDLCDRGGLQETWESYGDDDQDAIKRDWVNIAFSRLQPDMKDMRRWSEE